MTVTVRTTTLGVYVHDGTDWQYDGSAYAAVCSFGFDQRVAEATVRRTGHTGVGVNVNYWSPIEIRMHSGGVVRPLFDNGLSLGEGSGRWTAVYAVAGTINTSLADRKHDITPLDPAAALAAVLATDPVVFDYKPPERDAAWYALPDDPEQAEAVLYQRLTSAPLEAAARHQAGFVLASPDYATDPLFETGAGQSNAANSVGVLIGAIHALAARVTALEGA